MTEYKLELLIPRPMGIGNGDRCVKLEGVIADAQVALATYMLLDGHLGNGFTGKIEHTITIYRDDKEITREELSEDFSEYVRNLRLNKP